MTMLAALALLSLLAAQPAAPDPDSPPPPAPPPASSPPSATAEPPSIDSILEQEPLTEDARQAAVRGAFDAAQARRGSLDGRWRLSDAMGAPLYDFLLADRGEARPDPMAPPDQPPIEGAWRDLRRPGAINDAGALEAVRHEGERLTIAFTVPGSGALTLALEQLPSGVWMGETEIGGATVAVFLDRVA